jgi:hypothetical protein
MKFAVVARRRSATNNALVTAAHSWGLEAELLEPKRALSLLEPGDLALARLDVREGLDGIERGTGAGGAPASAAEAVVSRARRARAGARRAARLEAGSTAGARPEAVRP